MQEQTSAFLVEMRQVPPRPKLMQWATSEQAQPKFTELRVYFRALGSNTQLSELRPCLLRRCVCVWGFTAPALHYTSVCRELN